MGGDERKTIQIPLPMELVDRLDGEARSRLVGRNLLIEMMLTEGLGRLQPPTIFGPADPEEAS